jgi:hypothetical protein
MFTEHKSDLPLNTFIVRFWREPGTGQACWRGRVQHVQSDESAFFADETSLLYFLRRWVQMEGAQLGENLHR